MSLPGVWPQVLDFFGTPLVMEPAPGQPSGDAGVLPIRRFDEPICLSRSWLSGSANWLEATGQQPSGKWTDIIPARKIITLTRSVSEGRPREGRPREGRPR